MSALYSPFCVPIQTSFPTRKKAVAVLSLPMLMPGNTLDTHSPRPSICLTLKKYPLRVIHTEPSLSTSAALGMRLSFETLHWRESTMNLFPSSANATLNNLSLDVNQMHPLASLLKEPEGCVRSQALDTPEKPSATERDFKSRRFMLPASGTHNLP